MIINSSLQCPPKRRKLLILKYFFAFLLVFFVSTEVSAFGGRRAGYYEALEKGLDSFGIHYGGNTQVDIKFECEDKNATPDIHGVCKCNAGYKDENGVCVKDACANFKATDCIKTCTSLNGDATYTYGTFCSNGYFCNSNRVCENPCYDMTCQSCTPKNGEATFANQTNGSYCDDGACQSGTCVNMCIGKTWDNECQECDIHTGNITNKSNDTLCPDDDGADNYICQSGSCTDPCTIGEHASFEPTACITGHHAENGACVLDYAEKGTQNCDPDHPTYVCDGEGVCTCPEGWFLNSTESCIACSNYTAYEATAGACAKCDSTDYPRTIWEYNGTNYCALSTCPKDYFHNWYGGHCGKCSGTNGAATTQHACTECDDTDAPRFWNEKSALTKCESCHQSYFIETTQETCLKCTNRIWNETRPATNSSPAYGKCILQTCESGSYHGVDGACYECNDNFSSEATEEDCLTCDGARQISVWDGKNYCEKVICGTNKFHSWYGTCRSCSDSDSYRSTEEQCSTCTYEGEEYRKIFIYDNKTYCGLKKCGSGSYRTHTGGCFGCATKTYHATTAEDCSACENTENPRFIGTNDNCYLCTHSVSITTTEEACNKCTNRTWTETTPASGDNPATGTCKLNQ